MSKIMIGVTGKNKTPSYKLTLPKDLAEEFIKAHGVEVNVRKYGKNKLLIEPKEQSCVKG